MEIGTKAKASVEWNGRRGDVKLFLSSSILLPALREDQDLDSRRGLVVLCQEGGHPRQWVLERWNVFFLGDLSAIYLYRLMNKYMRANVNLSVGKVGILNPCCHHQTNFLGCVVCRVLSTC